MYDILRSNSLPSSINGVGGNVTIVGSGTIRTWLDGQTVQISEALSPSGTLGVTSVQSAIGPDITLNGKQGVYITKITDTSIDVGIDLIASGFTTLPAVQADLRASGYTTISEVHTDIGASGYQRLPTIYPIATDYTVKVSDRVLLVNASLAPRVITLPSAALASGITWNIKKVDNTINTVTVSGVELIDGSLTQIISLQYNNLTVIGDGSQYWIL